MTMHQTLIKYRVLYIAITFFFMWLAWDAWEWFKINQSDMKEFAVAGFITIYLAVIGVLKYVIENIRKDNQHD